MLRGALPLAIGFAVAIAMQVAIGPFAGPFAVKLLMDIGINIILAVSLNLVNGFTGSSRSATRDSWPSAATWRARSRTTGPSCSGADPRWSRLAVERRRPLRLRLPGGRSGGRRTGYIVGLPSLRLRGDYLAIVTLGFGEIFRVLLQRTGDVVTSADAVKSASVLTLATSVGGSLGFSGSRITPTCSGSMPPSTITLVVALPAQVLELGRAFLSIRENEIAARSRRHQHDQAQGPRLRARGRVRRHRGRLVRARGRTSLNPRELGIPEVVRHRDHGRLWRHGLGLGRRARRDRPHASPEALRGFSEFRMPIYALALILMMILRPQGILGSQGDLGAVWLPGAQREGRPPS
jgi:branched-chain amino acid transport system permease protein